MFARNSRFRTLLGWAPLLLLCLVGCGCQQTKPTYPDGVVPISAAEVIASKTAPRVKVALRRDAGLRSELAELSTQLAANPPQDRAALSAALGEHADTLQLSRIWARASADADFPDAVTEGDWVAGFLGGLAEALSEGEGQ